MFFHIDPSEVSVCAVRSQGAGGQNVNKVATAVHLRFDIAQSSLPDSVKTRLLATRDNRLTAQGVLVIKAQAHRTQELNRRDALLRLDQWVNHWGTPPKVRLATRPTRASVNRRLLGKARRSGVKQLRTHKPSCIET